jgi:predicted nucleic acid-binding protein
LISFDTNILVYAADRMAGPRHARSAELLERALRLQDCTQTLQSFCEFYNVVTRKTGVSKTAAAALIAAWSGAVSVVAAVPRDLATAMRAVEQYQLSFWDALLWATLRRAGIHSLISEDFQDGRVVEGVRIINPFAAQNSAIIEELLPRF